MFLYIKYVVLWLKFFATNHRRWEKLKNSKVYLATIVDLEYCKENNKNIHIVMKKQHNREQNQNEPLAYLV